MMPSRIARFFLVIQAGLLVLEMVAQYDVVERRIALGLTNVLSTVALLILDRLLRRRTGHPLPGAVWLSTMAALWFDAAGNFAGFYGRLPWWDDVAHMIGTAALAVLAGALVESWRDATRTPLSRGATVLIVVALAMLVASAYEISEYIGDLLFATHRIGDQYDTVSDLLYNLTGSLLVSLTLRRRT